jgi:ABC-type uncharacterized transport system substrate-binding protein
MRRREFLGMLGGTAAVWPLTARAQQPTMPVIGFLHAGSPAPSAEQVEAFRKGLAESGYVIGRNVTVEFRWAQGQYGRLPALASELVQHGVAVLAVGGGAGSRACGDDPVKYGLVASLNRPGGNITGAVFFNPALVAKRLELLRELVRSATAVAYLINPNNPESRSETIDAQAAARALGLNLHVQSARSEREIAAAFEDFREHGSTALVVGSDPFLFSRRHQVAALAHERALPVIGTSREYAVAGCLASYGNSIPEAFRWMGVYAGRILKGIKPADLPVVQSIRFELVINRKTAEALGLDIPPMLLATADEVIE